MNPVLVLRHCEIETPGYFAAYLDTHAIPWRMVKLDAGERPPREPDAFSGVVLMGGPMSVNDARVPWIAGVLRLIHAAVREDIPLLGHCLGGQLIAKALGGRVGPNPVKEIGWGEVAASDNEVAREWLGDVHRCTVFHWHGETFGIPPNATRIMEGAHCANQAFAMGKHLAMQCHVEMTEDLVRTWTRAGRREIEASADSPAVQSTDEIEHDLTRRIQALHAIAERLYGHWCRGLDRGT
jgi:GMP synthase-like glutamine amidotransferase